MFSVFKEKERFSKAEKEILVSAIRQSEAKTSGEIRVFIEGYCTMGNAYERAKEVFTELKMTKTKHRNAVLLYIALDERVLAMYCDTAIYALTGLGYWQDEVSILTSHFKEDKYVQGIEKCILQIGNCLAEHYPFENNDKNELPDDIVFGNL